VRFFENIRLNVLKTL